MAKFFDKVKIPTAISKRTHLSLDCRHTTTTDFFQFNIPYIRRMIPGEKLDIKVNAFSRLAGMPLPTFGDANLNLRAFFVPYRMVFPAWNEFITDSVRAWASGDTASIPTFVPRFANSSLVHILCSRANKIGVYLSIDDDGTPQSPVGSSVYSLSYVYNGMQVANRLEFYLFGLNPSQLECEYYVEENSSDSLSFVDGKLITPSHGLVGSYTFDESTGLLVITGLVGNLPYADQISFGFEASESVYDFHCASNDTTYSGYWKLDSKGRLIFKILRQLGYMPYFDLTTESTANMSYHSALDLLSWLKVYLDYYFPQQYFSYPIRAQLEFLTRYDSPNYVIPESDLVKIFDNCIMVCYASDFVTAAFDNPVGPTDGARSAVTFVDYTMTSDSDETNDIIVNNSSQQRDAYGTPNIQDHFDGDSVKPLSQFAITALRKLTDYVKRHQLAGATPWSRFLARFGIVLDNDSINRCYYIGSHHIPMVIGDVMATADTISENSGAALGDYAGKGFLIGNNGHFSFSSNKDYGLFIITSSIVPNIATYQGYDIHTKQFERLSYFTPEFDGLSTVAVEKGEICADPTLGISDPVNIRRPYGFFPNYYQYKIPYNRLTGDFNYPSLSQAGFTSDSWHLFRKFSISNYTNFFHNINIVKPIDYEQYLRIFYNQNVSADHFVVNYLFKVDSSAPVRPLYDSYDFEHDGGKEVDINVNGKRVN